MLVVDGHALVSVHPLHLVYEVLLGLPYAADFQKLLGIAGPVGLGHRVAGGHLLVFDHRQLPGRINDQGPLCAVVAHHGQPTDLAVLLGEANNPRDPGELGFALGSAGFEQLHDPGQTAGDVLAGHAAGVEGPHGELRARLADGLGGDNAHGFAHLDGLPSSEGEPVGGSADAHLGVVSEGRQHPDPGHGGVVAQQGHLLIADDGAPLQHGAIAEGHVISQGAAEQAGLQVGPPARLIRHDVVDPDAPNRPSRFEWVPVVDDDLLGHIDQAAGEIAGVRGAQGGVHQALASAGGGDEVLEHRQTLAEVALDGTGNHVAAGVGH